MKGRTTKGLLVVKDIISGMELAGQRLDDFNRSKLLSAKGCDIVEYSEDERDSRFSLSSAEQDFYKSLPEWNEGTL